MPMINDVNSRPFPFGTLILTLLTLVASFYVAVDVSGSPFGKIRIVQLENYGAVSFDHLRDVELWRLVTSQIIHVKPFHMLFNVLSLLLLGLFIERYLGAVRFLLLWFLPGAAGTLASTLFVDPPWNLGTGASQAVMGIAAFGLLLVIRRIDRSKGLKYSVAFAILPALVLDLVFAHYPKPGHLLGFLGGMALGIYFLDKTTRGQRLVSQHKALTEG